MSMDLEPRQPKVGLLSTTAAINYGAVLQAFALERSIRDLGFPVTTLDYRPDNPKFGRKHRVHLGSLKHLAYEVLCMVNLSYQTRRRRKVSEFDAFLGEHFQLSEHVCRSQSDLSHDARECDVLVCGSDQIWNLRLLDDEAFYLTFGRPDARRISYAASVGEELNQEQLGILAERIASFDAISVREGRAVGELARLSGKRIHEHVDPVFLLSPEQWVGYRNGSFRSRRPYVFLYEVGSPLGFGEFFKSVRSQVNLPVLTTSARPFNKYRGVTDVGPVTPFEFLDLIADAELVIASSFHGAAFAALLNRNFVSFPSPGRSVRHRTLFEKLGLGHRIISVDGLDTSVDQIESATWRDVNTKIEHLRSEGLTYLREAICGHS
jgi:hypothetical protein